MNASTASGAGVRPRIDWRTVLMLLPRRRFTAAELERGIPEALDNSLRLSLALNLGLPNVVLASVFSRNNPWYVAATMLACVAGLGAVVLRAWRDPSSAFVRRAYWLQPLVALSVASWMLRDGRVSRPDGVALAMIMAIGTLALWFVIVHRHQYVQMRLAELPSANVRSRWRAASPRRRSSHTSSSTPWPQLSIGCRPGTSAPACCSRR